MDGCCVATYETELDRYGPAIVMLFSGLTLIAFQFGAIVTKGGSPVTPELYGPAVYAMPALVWVGVQIFTSGLVVYGAHKRGRFGAWCVLIGGACGFVMHSAFAVLAQKATQGTLVQGASMFVTAPACFMVVLLAVRYLRNVR